MASPSGGKTSALKTTREILDCFYFILWYRSLNELCHLRKSAHSHKQQFLYSVTIFHPRRAEKYYQFDCQHNTRCNAMMLKMHRLKTKYLGPIMTIN